MGASISYLTRLIPKCKPSQQTTLLHILYRAVWYEAIAVHFSQLGDGLEGRGSDCWRLARVNQKSTKRGEHNSWRCRPASTKQATEAHISVNFLQAVTSSRKLHRYLHRTVIYLLNCFPSHKELDQFIRVNCLFCCLLLSCWIEQSL